VGHDRAVPSWLHQPQLANVITASIYNNCISFIVFAGLALRCATCGACHARSVTERPPKKQHWKAKHKLVNRAANLLKKTCLLLLQVWH
jgi:hypothetical protein